MARIIANNKEYSLYDFDNEAEFEKAVIENQKYLFGKGSIYIDVKRRIGRGIHLGIPDAFLIDFYDIKRPRLYIVENEIAPHDVYSHVTEQIARFGASIISSANEIRKTVQDAIENDPKIKKEVEKYLRKTVFRTLKELIYFLTENEINIVVVINEESLELNQAFTIFKNQPDVVILQRYMCGNEIAYYYQPMREEIEDIEVERIKINEAYPYDTIVCAAFPDGFRHAYIENSAWWSVRLSKDARENLKFLAIYEKAPISHISHYAEIDRIESYKDTGKYKIFLKNKRTLKEPINLGEAKKGDAPQAPRYTTLKHLLKAKKVTDLWFWRYE